MPQDPLKGSIPRRGLPGVSFANSNDSVARIPVATVPLQTYGPPESSEHPQVDPRMNNNTPTPGPVTDRDSEYASIGAVGSPGTSTIAKDFGSPQDPRIVPRIGFRGRQEGPGSTGQLFQFAQMGQSTTLKPPPGGNSATGRGLIDQQQGNATFDNRLQPIRPDSNAEPRRIDAVGVPMAFGNEPSSTPVDDGYKGQVAFLKR